MKEVERISLGGYAFTFEKDAATLAQNYLRELENYYSGREGGSEILDGIEERMAELLQEKCGRDGIVSRGEIERVMKILGKPEDIEAGDDAGPRRSGPTEAYPHRRLFRDLSNKVVGGVCSGLGAYFRTDPVLFRILFVLFTLIGFFGHWNRWHTWVVPFFSTPVFIYIILWIIMPAAKTVQQRWAQRGEDGSINSIERNIEKGAKEFEKTVVRVSHSNGFNEVAKVIGKMFGLLLLLVGFAGVFTAGLVLFGSGSAFMEGAGNGIFGLGHLIGRGMHELYIVAPSVFRALMHPWMRVLVSAIIFLPFLGLLYGGLQLIFDFKSPRWSPGLIIFILWLLCIIAAGILFAIGFWSTELNVV